MQVKRASDHALGVVSQCIVERNVTKPDRTSGKVSVSPQYTANVALKVSCARCKGSCDHERTRGGTCTAGVLCVAVAHGRPTHIIIDSASSCECVLSMGLVITGPIELSCGWEDGVAAMALVPW